MSQDPISRLLPWVGVTAVVIVVVVLIIVWPRPGPSPLPEPSPPTGAELRELVDAWNSGNAALDRFQFQAAAAAFRRVADRVPSSAAAWVNLGLATMNQDSRTAFLEAEKHLREALRLDPGNPHGNHCLGILLKHLSRPQEAEACFRRVLERDPHDPTAHYYLGNLLAARDQDDEAEKHLRAAIAAEPHQQSAVFQLFNMYYGQDDEAKAAPLVEIFQRLQVSETGNTAGIVYSEMGRYGAGIRTFPLPWTDVPASLPVVRYTAEGLGGALPEGRKGSARPTTLPVPPGRPPAEVLMESLLSTFGPGVALGDVDGNGNIDIWVADGKGAGRLWINHGTSFEDASAAWGLSGGAPSISGCFGDFDNDGHVDLYVCCAGPNRLLRNTGRAFEDVTASSGTGGGNRFSTQAVMADLDADGDLDIFVAQLHDLELAPSQEARTWPAGLPGTDDQLFNNNRDGTFTDIAPRTGTTGDAGRSMGVLAADLDDDHDADIVILQADDGARVYRNDRIWRFVEMGDLAGVSTFRGDGIVAADIDQDGHLDLLFLGSTPALLLGEGGLRFAMDARLPLDAATAGGSGCVLDSDSDGDQDVIVGSTLFLQGPGGVWSSVALPEDLGDPGVRTVLPADLDGDGILDIVVSHQGGSLVVCRGEAEASGTWVAIDLEGVRSEGKMRANTGGVGARVKVVAETLVQQQDVLTAAGVLGCPSPTLHFGLGRRAQADYVSIVWPDDLVQGESHLSAGTKKTITQVYRKSSSCPLLFAWDGERMAFVTDFLGVGGLGFFVEPGVYAPPDPTESVWIPRLHPRDGVYELSIHEPMEEVCYLDEAKLLVIDHPAGMTVVPDERLAVLGPAPDGRLIAYREVESLWPRALTTLEGPADPGLLHQSDRRYQPGVRPDRRFLGYAAPQEIILDFGDDLRGAGASLVLFLDGWVEYPYSHVNFAAWQAGLSLQALSLDVETSPGSWITHADRFGYPAGMPRIMTFDVSDIPRDGTGRLRLRTNLELFIDRLWLAPDHGPDTVTVLELDPTTAVLRPSGYPREYTPDGRAPLLYDYTLMDPAIDYKTMAGAYTRFGDVVPLLLATDDQYVVMGRAEEIRLTFSAPKDPAPDRARSFILRSHGYCKDMDLYTAHPATVGPLPFQSMSTYPYPPGERYPDTPAHRAYHQRWNTRRLTGRGR